MYDFVFDLTGHEQTRLAAVVDALGDSYDPAEILAGEQAAYAMLYSGLDEQQQAVYDQLHAAGVL